MTLWHKKEGNYLEFSIFCRKFASKLKTAMKESKPYPIFEEEDDGACQSSGSCLTAQEPSTELAYAYEEPVIPDDVECAYIVDDVLQVTPDIEEEIAEVERGEVVSMSEFKTMFAKWL